MIRKFLKIALSVLAAVFFLMLAFREVDLQELLNQISRIRLGWIIPFIAALIVSHWLRALRWMLMLHDLDTKPSRLTLFTGVMVGYMMNYVFPRLGEVSRPVYVARKIGESSGNLFGTIVLERVIDLVCLIGFLIVISFYYVNDQRTFSQIFGTEGWTTSIYLLLPAFILVFITAAWAGYRLLVFLKETKNIRHPLLARLMEFSLLFWNGLLSIRKIQNWGLFAVYTLGIWAGYIVMAYLPFMMLDLHTEYGLGLTEAMIITVISAVGISIPTPGGIGSYHLFIQQSLWLLYSVPLVSALTYATIVHAITLLIVFLSGILMLWLNKYYTLKENLVR